MMKKEIIVITLLLISGGVVYLQPTDSYKNCKGGWELTDTGEYYCESRDITEWCYKLSDSGYRCYVGIPIEQEQVTYDDSIIRQGDKWWTTDGEVCYFKGDLKKVEECP